MRLIEQRRAYRSSGRSIASSLSCLLSWCDVVDAEGRCACSKHVGMANMVARQWLCNGADHYHFRWSPSLCARCLRVYAATAVSAKIYVLIVVIVAVESSLALARFDAEQLPPPPPLPKAAAAISPGAALRTASSQTWVDVAPKRVVVVVFACLLVVLEHHSFEVLRCIGVWQISANK